MEQCISINFYCFDKNLKNLLIHEADPQSRPVVIIVFTHVVRTPSLLSKSNQNKTYFIFAFLGGVGWKKVSNLEKKAKKCTRQKNATLFWKN